MFLPKNLFYKFLISFFIITFGCIVYASYSPFISRAEDSVEKEIEKKEKELKEKESQLSKIKEKAASISSNISKLTKNLGATKAEVAEIQKQINEINLEIEETTKILEERNKNLEQKKKVRDLSVRNLYISQKTPILAPLFSGHNISESLEKSNYFLSFIGNTQSFIGKISTEINDYEKDKKELEETKTTVEKDKKELVTLQNKIAQEMAAAKTQLAQASQTQMALENERSQILKKLDQLSQSQKEVLEDKAETFETSVGEVPATGDPNSRADYNPGFKTAFAAFSFGAPHRMGMSQYGAKGRAESGQDYKSIIKAYYGDVEIKKVDDIPGDIKTDKGTMSFEKKYLWGISEMPASWPKEAQKAQAILARTYALSRIGWRISSPNASGSICTTESCQVWTSSKSTASSAANWHDAVDDTKGLVLVSNKTGEIFSPLYAATSGGYINSYSSMGHTTPGIWDTKCKSKDCWTGDAYEKIAGASWFYKGWYKTRSNKSCSRNHPWLTEEEIADIVGALVLYKKDSGNQKHLSQTDSKKCWGKDVSDTWSKDTVKEKSGITSVDSFSVTYSSNGKTDSVKIKTNKGETSYSGSDFKAIFNLRAPGAIQIKSDLFNIEVKK